MTDIAKRDAYVIPDRGAFLVRYTDGAEWLTARFSTRRAASDFAADWRAL